MKIKIIGNAEWCALKELNLPAIRARIDSGAKTSSLQATDIKLFKKEEEDWVQFVVYPIQKDTKTKVECSAKLVDKRSIKSSFGKSEERLIIRSPITIGNDTFNIEISLASRSSMAYRMLLGREAISGRYLINTSEKHVQKVYSRKTVIAKYDTHRK